MKNWKDELTDPTAVKVFEALENPDWDFRTISGLASDTGLESTTVEKILEEHNDMVRLSAAPGPQGQNLYTLNDPTAQETWSIARGSISKSPPSSS